MNRKQRRLQEKEDKLKAKRVSKRVDYETRVILHEDMVNKYGVDECIDMGMGYRETYIVK